MKTPLITAAIFGLVCAAGIGCKTATNGTDGSDTTKVDSIVFDPTPECLEMGPKQFCWAGLDFIRLGDSLTWKQYAAPEGGVFKDTVFSDTTVTGTQEQITDWNVRMLRFASGTVFLEADFDQGFLLNRVRVETPEYRMKNGLGLGSTAGEVMKAFEGEGLLVGPFEEYGVMELIRPVIAGNTRRQTTFHFPLGSWYKPGQEQYTLADIPADAKVVRIVLM